MINLVDRLEHAAEAGIPDFTNSALLKEAAAEIRYLRQENEKTYMTIFGDALDSIDDTVFEVGRRQKEYIETLEEANAKLKYRIRLYKSTRNEKVFGKLMDAHERIEKLQKLLDDLWGERK